MKKIILNFLLIIFIAMAIIMPNNSNAFSISSADLYSKGYYENYLKWGGAGVVFNYVVYEKDGVEYPAYCLNKELDGVSLDNGYSVSIDEYVTNTLVYRAIINGYPYKTPEELGCNSAQEAYLATKQAVYCVLYDRDPNEYSATDDVSQRTLDALKTIVNVAKTSSEIKVSSDLEISTDDKIWIQDIKDDEYVSKTYMVSTTGAMQTYTIQLEGDIVEGTKIVNIENEETNNFESGQKFKILIPIQNLTKDGTLKIIAKAEVKTKPILFGLSSNNNYQNYALTAYQYEEGEGNLNVNYNKNETQIIIKKLQEENKEPIAGVEFQVLNEKEQILYSNLITNEQGEIIIKNLKPGMYYVKETKTLEGYQIYESLIEVNLNLNEAVTVTVNNSKEEVNIQTDLKKEESSLEISNKEVSNKLPKTGY